MNPELFAAFELIAGADLPRRTTILDSGTVEKIDTIHDQLRELLEVRQPGWNATQIESSLTGFKLEISGSEPDNFGTWAYYPWRKSLVHLMPRPLFHEVRTNRNRNKISVGEQTILDGKTIAIIGLSIGQAILAACVLDGVAGEFKLADGDTLAMTNMNRLRSSVLDLGKLKVDLAARMALEQNPFLSIIKNNDWINESNIEKFLEDPVPDLVFEVCDSLPEKLLIREHCRARHIPVIMDTSDQCLIDVERFDLEPGRPLLHGLLGKLSYQDALELSPKDRVPFALAFVGGIEAVSDRMRDSLSLIGKELRTWPQLGSEVMLGAGASVEFARRILLGFPCPSGRFRVGKPQSVLS